MVEMNQSYDSHAPVRSVYDEYTDALDRATTPEEAAVVIRKVIAMLAPDKFISLCKTSAIPYSLLMEFLIASLSQAYLEGDDFSDFDDEDLDDDEYVCGDCKGLGC